MSETTPTTCTQSREHYTLEELKHHRSCNFLIDHALRCNCEGNVAQEPELLYVAGIVSRKGNMSYRFISKARALRTIENGSPQAPHYGILVIYTFHPAYRSEARWRALNQSGTCVFQWCDLRVRRGDWNWDTASPY